MGEVRPARCLIGHQREVLRGPSARLLNLNHENATLATMLDVASPRNVATSLVTVNGAGRIVLASSIEPGRIVRFS